MSEDVVILGAGFSKAISDQMPMTADLGKMILQRLTSNGTLGLPSRTFSGPQLEAWLSRLAEPQPDLSAAANAANQARFLEVSQTLREVIVECQTAAHGGELPWWLRRMLGALHYAQATVVTFNYDTLVETAVSACNLFDDESTKVYPSQLLRHMPPTRRRPAGGMSFGPGNAQTFHYIKLHGSVDTFWIPGDASGASIGRWELPGAWGAPRIGAENERRQVLPGTEAYIVPPAAAKSAFYANPLARELWRTTAEAIRSAKRVAVVGYSIPMTDLVTSGMLSEALVGTSSEVTVVSRTPAPIALRLEDLGVEATRIHQISGANSVQTFAEGLDRSFEPGLDHPDSDDWSLTIGSGRNPSTAINRILNVDADGTARILVGNEPWAAARVTVRDLHGRAGPVKKIEIVDEDGREAMVARALPDAGGADGPRCLVLTPTARS